MPRVRLVRLAAKITSLSLPTTSRYYLRIQSAGFARRRTPGGSKKGGLAKSRAPPPPANADLDLWVEVKDEASGQVYYWNTETDETTELGAPKPQGMYAPITEAGQMQGQAPGFMGMVAQGFAFGAGSSIAHGVMGGMFGGGGDAGGGDMSGVGGDMMGGGGGDGGGGGGENDDGSWDI